MGDYSRRVRGALKATKSVEIYNKDNCYRIEIQSLCFAAPSGICVEEELEMEKLYPAPQIGDMRSYLE